MAIDDERRSGVAYMTLNNPGKANIMDKATSDAIPAVWKDLLEDPEIRCAIVTGAGEKPVIAAINGWAAGAGFYMLLSSTDIRIASAENTRFKFALLSQGWLGHGPGATLLTDDPFDAAEALRIGLINDVVPHAMMKEFVHRFGEMPADQAWQVQTLMNALLIHAAADGEEGRRAFTSLASTARCAGVAPNGRSPKATRPGAATMPSAAVNIDGETT